MDKVMVIVDGEHMIDYAYPCMMAEKHLAKAHDLMLEGKYEEAIQAGLEALADTKLMINAIRDMEEKRIKR